MGHWLVGRRGWGALHGELLGPLRSLLAARKDGRVLGGLWGLQSVFSDAPSVVAPSDTAGASWQHQLGFRAPQAVPLKGGADSHLLRVPQGPVHWHGQDLVPA